MDFQLPPSLETAQSVADLFSAFSDPRRVQLIAVLVQRGEASVGDLAEAVGLTLPAASHHLRLLLRLRLVRTRKEGRQVFYALDDDHVAHLFYSGLEHVGEKAQGK
ncbi:MAG: transcriptional regulator [Anaerolineae bacterium]|nr:MAG: transcriptional regulator [Anaerolineae bacterium]